MCRPEGGGASRSGSRRFATGLRDHMNPRSSCQPSEYHSRRLSDVMAPLGWIIARDVHMTAMGSAPTP